jgi:uncharacterized membrane protein
MIGLPFVYVIAGCMFAAFAILGAADRTNPRRLVNGGFWALLALSFLAGDRLGDVGNGVLVLALVALAMLRLGRGQPPTTSKGDRFAEAASRRNSLFIPALVVPAVTLVGTLLFKQAPAWVDTKQATLVALACGVLIALGLSFAWFKPRLATPLQEGRRLMDAVGWAAVLPQMLAALGALFAAAGVGNEVGRLMGEALPSGSLIAAVFAYGFGMALLTVLMGNAFAAFPVMTAAIGLPLLIQQHHGVPAGVAALGMLTGFCGTLLTPMAANFNIVPAALLELPDRYGVIRAQAPTALVMFVVNLALMYFLVFP